MRKRRKKKPENGSNWMDTYGDMVTLLLCFFVLLYSISSVDQSKWIKLVESFNPDAKEVSQIVTDTVADGNDEVPGSAEASEEAVFDELYKRRQRGDPPGGKSHTGQVCRGDRSGKRCNSGNSGFGTYDAGTSQSAERCGERPRSFIGESGKCHRISAAEKSGFSG